MFGRDLARGGLSLLAVVTASPIALGDCEPRLVQRSEHPAPLSSDLFGYSVATSGADTVIGVPGVDTPAGSFVGAAYVLQRSGSIGGAALPLVPLTPPDGEEQDFFGGAVAIDGNTIAIGARNGGYAPNPISGSVYIYTRTDGVWSLSQELNHPTAVSIGNSVAMFGDWLVTGAPFESIDAGQRGAVYVYRRTSGSWAFHQRLIAESPTNARDFGIAVALDDRRVLIGAGLGHAGATQGAGTAHVFVRDPDTNVWSFEDELFAADAAESDYFGGSVAIFGDRALIGAPFRPDSNSLPIGTAYAFVRSGSTWSQTQQFNGQATTFGPQFGKSVALSARHGVIGGQSGQVYPLDFAGGIFQQRALIEPTPTAGADAFGGSVALHGGTLAVGSFNEDSGSVAQAGSAYLYELAAAAPLEIPGTGMLINPDYYGQRVAADGDTVAIAGPAADTINGPQSGAVKVYRRVAGLWTLEATLVAQAAGGGFGGALALDGDTLAISTGADVGGVPGAGAVEVFTRSGGAWTFRTRLFDPTPTANSGFGSGVALDGDTLAIGNRFDTPELDGALFVFRGGDDSWTLEDMLDPGSNGCFANGGYGSVIALRGDLLLAGAPSIDFDPDGNGPDFCRGPFGALYSFHRTGTTWTKTGELRGSAERESLGVAVAIGDDFVVYSSSDAGQPFPHRGRVYVAPRTANSFDAINAVELDPRDLDSRSGYGNVLAASGERIAVGVWFDAFGSMSGIGSAHVFERLGGAWRHVAKLSHPAPAASDTFGLSVDISGTLVIAGAPARFAGGPDQGSSYIFEIQRGRPTILTQPASQLTCDGGDVTLNVETDSYEPVTYQWSLDGQPIGGATSASLLIDNAGAADLGAYACTVSNSCGDVVSSAAILSICEGCVGDVNCSCSVGLTDLSLLLTHFGTTSGATLAQGDLDGDGDVDLTDLSRLLGNFGRSCD